MLSPSNACAVTSITWYARTIVEIGERSIGLGSYCGFQLVDQSAEVARHGTYKSTALYMGVDVQYHGEILQVVIVDGCSLVPPISFSCVIPGKHLSAIEQVCI